MKMYKKLLFSGVAFATAFSLTACGSSEENTSSTEESGDVITINFWEQDDANVQEELDVLIEKFESENENIDITRSHYDNEELRKQFTASLGGNGPDVVLGPNDNLGVFVAADIIQDLTDVMGEEYFADFDETALESAQFQGAQYMLPDRNGNELLLIYNKALVPDAPATMEELIEEGQALQDAGTIQYPLTFNKVEPFFSIPFYAAFDGQIFDDVTAEHPTPTLDTQATADWMAYLKMLQDEKVIPQDADGDVSDSLFKEGKTAFIINGPWGLSAYEEAGIDYGIAAIPSINGKDSSALTAVKGYSVAKSVEGEKLDAVKEFLTFMNTEESQVALAKVHQQSPTLTAAINNEEIANDAVISAQMEPIEKGTPMPTVTEMRFVWDAIKPVQQEVLAGSITPEDAPAEIQKRTEEGISAAGLTE